MLYEYPQDPETANLGDQFMLGSQLLVAPVVKAGARAREVWLPKGEWTDFWTSQRIKGGRYHLAQAPMDTLPLYLKEGAILPLWKEASSTSKRDRSFLSLDLHPFAGESRFSLYTDDGESYDFEKGKFARLNYSLEYNPLSCQIRLKLEKSEGPYVPGYRQIDLRFHGLQGRPRLMLVDNKPWKAGKTDDGQVVHGLRPGHFQARLCVPFSTREVLLQGVPGLATAL
jgi:alpha-glucosidase